MGVADLADAGKIARDRGHGAQGRADHGFADEADDGFGAELGDLLLQLACHPRSVILFALVIPSIAIGVAGRDVVAFT
jgi:hypothetical protein